MISSLSSTHRLCIFRSHFCRICRVSSQRSIFFRCVARVSHQTSPPKRSVGPSADCLFFFVRHLITKLASLQPKRHHSRQRSAKVIVLSCKISAWQTQTAQTLTSAETPSSPRLRNCRQLVSACSSLLTYFQMLDGKAVARIDATR